MLIPIRYKRDYGKREREMKSLGEFDARKFVEEHYVPVEDKPGYVWLSKRNMRIISIDLLVGVLLEAWEKSNGNKEEILSYKRLLEESEE